MSKQESLTEPTALQAFKIAFLLLISTKIKYESIVSQREDNQLSLPSHIC